jgi:hypothetical protein
MLVFCYLVDEGGGEVSLVPVAPDARRIFVCIFVCVVFLAVAQPILVFFLLRPNNYNEEEAAYVSILLSLR